MIRRTIPETKLKGLTSIPHGIDTAMFYPRLPSRNIFHSELQFNGPEILPQEKIIGIIATNQARKDWGLAFNALARLAKEMPIRIYIQTDVLERYWSFPSLVMDYGLMQQTILNTNATSDDTLARIYSTCDLTLGIGPEGFGYPIFESLACGTPVLAGNYGGHAEHMHGDNLPPHSLIQPKEMRLEGVYNCERPVYDPAQWAYYAGKMLRTKKTGASLLPAHLDWNNLWSRWSDWFIQGITVAREDRVNVTCGD
jgi:glycosyltransferase involved in cell wall biosynthesis